MSWRELRTAYRVEKLLEVDVAAGGSRVEFEPPFIDVLTFQIAGVTTYANDLLNVEEFDESGMRISIVDGDGQPVARKIAISVDGYGMLLHS